MDSAQTSMIQLVIQGGALGLLTLVLLGVGWLLVRGFQVLARITKTQADSLKEMRDGFERMLVAQRSDAINLIDRHRNEHLEAMAEHRATHAEEIRSLRESLVSSLDRNTQATSMLTNALVTKGGSGK